MSHDEIDRIFSREEEILPSSGFSASVMDAVRREAASASAHSVSVETSVARAGARGVDVNFGSGSPGGLVNTNEQGRREYSAFVGLDLGHDAFGESRHHVRCLGFGDTYRWRCVGHVRVRRRQKVTRWSSNRRE